MGNGKGLGLLALLGLVLFLKKPTNGLPSPYVPPPVYIPTYIPFEVPTTILETFITTEKQISILEKMKETLVYHKEKVEYFRTVQEEHEEHLEDLDQTITGAKTLQQKILEAQKDVSVLKKMVQPTTTFDPTKLTQADLDKAQALALVSRPAAGMRHGQSVPN